MNQKSSADSQVDQKSSGPAQLIRVIGYILGFSYPILALSAGTRGLYQIFFRDDIPNKLGPALSVVAALVYVTAAFGFLTQRKWAWKMSVASLAFELIGIVIVGSLSFAFTDALTHTAWSRFGIDYGFFPLFQPVLGLVWLFWPETLRTYRIGERR